MGVPAASRILTTSRPRGVGANIPLPPGIRAQHATRVAGILFCQPLKGVDRAVQSRPSDSVHFSPESGKKMIQTPPALDTLKFMLEPAALDPNAEPPALRAFISNHSSRVETGEQKVIKSAARSYSDNKPLASIDKIAGNDNVYRHFSSMMLRLAGRAPIAKLSPAPPYYDNGGLTFEGRMSKTWVESLSRGSVRDGEFPKVWTNCLRPADPSDRRNFLVTIVLDQKNNPLYQFISTSGAPRQGEIDSNSGQIRFKMKGADRSGQHVWLSARMLSGSNDNQSRLQGAMNQVGAQSIRDFTYIGYDDLLARFPDERVSREVRVLPRTLPYSSAQGNEVRDRARDTEYLVMSALSMIFQDGRLPKGAEPRIFMFSTNEMCSACEGASSVALTRPEFAPVKEFVIYAPGRP